MDEHEQMELLHEIFDPSLPRLGPGDSSSTGKALEILLPCIPDENISGNPSGLRVLDIGCGPGAQTIELAKQIDGTIQAVDNHKPYLDELMRRADTEGVSEKINTLHVSMSEIALEPESFDLIWSEGAIFVIGFRNGFEAWRRLLAPRGLIAVTELCWFKPDPPAECKVFFDNEYPDMTDIETNLCTIEECGYRIIEHFKLPESAWLEEYYDPLERRLGSFKQKYAEEPEKLEFVQLLQQEIDIYRKYHDFYGYVFFLAEKH